VPTLPSVGASGEGRADRRRLPARLLCRPCGRTYTPEPKARGRGEEARRTALEYYGAWWGVRQTALLLSVSPQTIVNWADAEAGRDGAESDAARRRSYELALRAEARAAKAGLAALGLKKFNLAGRGPKSKD
jgi:hypothetical protein